MHTASRFFMIACLFAAAGCSAPQVSNTSLDSTDLVAMTDQMAQSMLKSAEISGRTEASPAWIVTLDRASNKTNSVIPQRELWAFMARLRVQLSQSNFMRRHNIVFVLSKDAAAAVNAAEADRLPGRSPTHALAATFYSITSATTTSRSDSYLCAFQLIDAASGQILWEDKYEIKRAVMRNVLD